MFRYILLGSTLLAMLLTISASLASGSRGSTSFPSTRSVTAPRSVEDITYEHGKNLFKGRDRRYGKIKYCVADGTDRKKVKKRSLKPYAGGSSKVLAENLYNCDNPNQKIQSVMNTTDMTALVYYLNKRHKLALN